MISISNVSIAASQGPGGSSEVKVKVTSPVVLIVYVPVATFPAMVVGIGVPEILQDPVVAIPLKVASRFI